MGQLIKLLKREPSKSTANIFLRCHCQSHSHSPERKMKHAEFWENEIRVRTTLVLPCSELQGHHYKMTVNLEQYDVNDRYVDCGYLVGW